MADTVRVQFSASIGALINGVEDAKKAINSVRTSVDSVTEGARSLLEAFGVAFSVERIIDFVSQMAEAGEQIERSSLMIGASSRVTQELGYAAKMTGGDTQTMAQAMERLQVSIQRAQNPTSQQALALHALGLSAKDLIGLPLDQQMDRFADAVSKFADGPNKTAAIGAINRGFIQMLPLLDQGSAGMEQLRDQAENTGAVMSERTVKALSDLEHAGAGAKASLMTLGAELAAHSSTLLNFANGLAVTAGNMTKMAETGRLSTYVLANLEQFAKQAAMAVAQLAQAEWDLARFDFSGLTKHWQEWDAAITKTATQSMADLDAMLKKADADYKALLSQKPQELAKPNVPAINTNIGNETSQQQSAIQEQIKSVDDYFAHLKEGYAAQLAQHKITVDQETADLIAAIRQRDTSEQTWFNSEIDLVKASGKNWETVEKQKTAAHDKATLEIQKATDDAVKKDEKEWQSTLQPLVSSFDSQLKGLLSKTETWGQAMKKVFADLVMDEIKNLEKLAVEKAAAGLTSAFGGGPQSALASLFGGQSSGATTANTLALTTLNATVAANTIALGGSTAASATSGAASAAGGAGGIFSVFSTLLKFLPGFADGSWSVPQDMVAQVHANEMIVPAAGGLADGLRGMIAGGGPGGAVTLNMSGNVGTQAWTQSTVVQLSRALQSYNARTPSNGW